MKLSADRTTYPKRTITRKKGEAPLAIAKPCPAQDKWTEEEYLALDNSGQGMLIELVDGCLEVLPLPDLYHQTVLKNLFFWINDHISKHRLGEVFFAPCPVHLWKENLREPDIFFLKRNRIKDRHTPPEGADLVVEIVSPGSKNRQRDLKDKRKAYAKATIPEYWIVDPKTSSITVLALSGKSYKTHGKYKPGDQATSKLLPGFAVDVRQVFAAGLGT